MSGGAEEQGWLAGYRGTFDVPVYLLSSAPLSLHRKRTYALLDTVMNEQRGEDKL